MRWMRKRPLHLFQPITKPRAVDAFQAKLSVPALVYRRVYHGFWAAGVWVELHAVGFDAQEGSGVGPEQDVGDLGQHGIGEVLYHKGTRINNIGNLRL